ncbi:hypothetical protein GGR55DRAFT_403091 [Xylaria sp. FL0064]|nr:hypothetical protein GGR55DRAFT_403091 [Xylaria sp. FL0064]
MFYRLPASLSSLPLNLNYRLCLVSLLCSVQLRLPGLPPIGIQHHTTYSKLQLNQHSTLCSSRPTACLTHQTRILSRQSSREASEQFDTTPDRPTDSSPPPKQQAPLVRVLATKPSPSSPTANQSVGRSKQALSVLQRGKTTREGGNFRLALLCLLARSPAPSLALLSDHLLSSHCLAHDLPPPLPPVTRRQTNSNAQVR